MVLKKILIIVKILQVQNYNQIKYKVKMEIVVIYLIADLYLKQQIKISPLDNNHSNLHQVEH